MKLALLVIDMQKAYFKGDSKVPMEKAAEYIGAILGSFRAQKLPVIWVQNVDEEDGALPGTEGYEIIESLKPLEGEYRVSKTYGNSFNKTDCLELLRKHEVDTPIITGYCSEYCVLSTYRGALDHDLTPAILKKGIASDNGEHTRFVEDICTTISYGILRKMLSS